MATVQFSIPDGVRDKFDEVFEGQDTNTIITTLMIRAVEDEERRRRSLSLVERLRLIRGRSGIVSAEEIRRAREELRE